MADFQLVGAGGGGLDSPAFLRGLQAALLAALLHRGLLTLRQYEICAGESERFP